MPSDTTTPDPEARFCGLPPCVEYVDGRQWRLHRDISYTIATGRFAGATSTVRAGFEFDWASVPAVLWPVLPPAGNGRNHYGIAALWHDWLMVHHAIGGYPCERRDADDLFREIMLYVGVSRWLARAMWLAVRAGSWAAWRKGEQL
jgi:hypothetical protein